MNQLFKPHPSIGKCFGIDPCSDRTTLTALLFALVICVGANAPGSSSAAEASKIEPAPQVGGQSEAESHLTSSSTKLSKSQQKRLARQQQRELRKKTPPEISNHTTSDSLLKRWSFGTQPYGYDHLGLPDPYFCYPYSLDPWERGSFRAPDLLDDPYFYDRVPVSSILRHRSSRKQQTDPHATTTAPEQAQVDSPPQMHAASEAPTEERELTPESAEILERLEISASTLAEQLLRYPNGEQWVRYLQPNMLPIMAAKGRYSTLNELLTRYDQTFVKPDVQTVSAIEGFEQSREELRRFLQSIQ